MSRLDAIDPHLHPQRFRISLIKVFPVVHGEITDLKGTPGKKQLNQLIGFLDKGGSVKDSLGARENQAVRTVRAKREAEEAGKLHID